MSKTTKKWIITATYFSVIGLILFGGGMFMNKWDFTKLSANKFLTDEYEVENFNDLIINSDTADIEFFFTESNEEKCKVVCFEDQKAKHSVTVYDNTLNIELIDNKSWYDHIGINFKKPNIKVYLPKSEYGSLSIKESTGNITVPQGLIFAKADISLSTGNIEFLANTEKAVKIKSSTGKIGIANITAESLEASVTTGNMSISDVTCKGNINLKVTTGKTNLQNIKCENLITNGTTGKISLNNVIANESFDFKRTTGDIKFEKCDAKEIYMQTSTGDVEGSFISDKVYITNTNTGNIDVPKTTNGGRCEIETNTGNIKIKVIS